MIARNPTDVLARHPPKVERREMMTLNAEQAAQILEAIKHKRIYWPVLTALSTGMRRGDIGALRWSRGTVGALGGTAVRRDAGLRSAGWRAYAAP